MTGLVNMSSQLSRSIALFKLVWRKSYTQHNQGSHKLGDCSHIQSLMDTGAQVLDTASSAGRPAVPLAKVLPHVRFISTDLAPSSTELALKYAEDEGVTNVTAQTADAQDLQAFADATFAAVTCILGLLFMPEFDKALKEAYRVLQPGGLYVATLWAEPEQVQMSQVCCLSLNVQPTLGLAQSRLLYAGNIWLYNMFLPGSVTLLLSKPTSRQ